MRITREQALDNLGKAVVARAIADACEADSLCTKKSTKEARKWLASGQAAMLSDYRAEKALREMEADYDGFRERFSAAWKAYGKQRA